MKKVDKQTFDKFLLSYPGQIEECLHQYKINYCDFSLGAHPDCVVAKIDMYFDKQRLKFIPEKYSFYIKEFAPLILQ